MSRIYVAYTGGTIGMHRGSRGLAPQAGWLEARMRSMTELQGEGFPHWDLIEYEPLLDSADMEPAHWVLIACDIAARYEEYDGFVVLHGTDTLAYTASALPFLLPGLRKPLIVTGSQIPLAEARTDARDHIVTSLELAARRELAEVCVYFDGKLLRGCRTTKVDALSFTAFDSPNAAALGDVGVGIKLHRERLRKPPEFSGGPMAVRSVGHHELGVLRLFPGIDAELLRRVLEPPLNALVLQVYGSGTGPSRDARLLDAVREATDRGVVIVTTSQCPRGRIDEATYAAAAAWRDAGVTPGQDMTVEAALAKLFVLLGHGLDPEAIRREILRNHCGELTPASD